MIDRIFQLKKHGTDIKTESIAGSATFLTMAYIIFFQPVLLSQAGMDFGAVMVATCISSAIACFVMGIFANYPIALAPGMGENFFFTFTVCIAMGVSWQTALAIVFLSGVTFFILTALKFRQMVIDSIPSSLKSAIAVGIGMLIAFIGLTDAGIIVRNNAGLSPIAFMDKGEMSAVEFLLAKFQEFQYASGAVKLGNLGHPAVLLSLLGLAVMVFLMARKVKGAILWGILISLAVSLVAGMVKWEGVLSAPPSIKPTLFQLDFTSALTLQMLPIILVFLFMDVFDTIGTFIGVSEGGELLEGGKMVRVQKALYADATGTMIGAVFGTSTVTSFIESTAGIQAGGRTGATAVVTGMLFLLALFFYPLVKMVGGGFPVGDNLVLYPITAPALIVVGILMAKSLKSVEWGDFTEAVPAFLLMMGMPLTYSIADGLAFGFITYPVMKIFSGRFKECPVLMYVLGGLFVLRYLFL
jgi:AGZA family xanthine/uracil permease-like MFS transporter